MMMKHDFRDRAVVKALAVLLAIACGVVSAFGWIYCGVNWDSMFEVGDFTYSNTWSQALSQSIDRLNQRLNYEWAIHRWGALNYLDQQSYEAVLYGLGTANTNFRYTVRDNATGELLFSSSGEDSLNDTIDGSAYLRQYDARNSVNVDYDPDRGLYFWTDESGTELGSAETVGDTPQAVKDLPAVQWAVEYGVDRDLYVEDGFREARDTYSVGNIKVLYVTCALSVVWLILTVFLMCCAARRRSADAFVLNWQDKIPYDLYLCAVAGGAALCFGGGVSATMECWRYYSGEPYAKALYGIAAVLFTGFFILAEAGIMSTAARIKTHTLLKNTLICRLLRWLGRLCKALGRWGQTTFGSWDVTHRVIVGFLLYLLGTLLTSFTVVLIPFYQGAALFGLCKWVKGWRAIREGTAAIVGGAPETVIDTDDMDRFICKDLKEHAGQLNDLGSAINSAVEERMKSELMKAQLITNVSHDLKTPLTSIINYVDLLKKEDIENETARGYIEVLDRKSQRLKKLTEDLVEASKASTGAIAVTAERLDMTQLVNQALGEYSEKFAAAQLAPVPSLPDGEVWVSADGRHMWRILDNLLGNCLKYALPGTRVYLDLVKWDGNVVLSVKNVSAQQLNIPAEQLMERFVRGDESRTTEGSGLGLSIARSLTELQGGVFRLEVDGDLFKAVISLPEAK